METPAIEGYLWAISLNETCRFIFHIDFVSESFLNTFRVQLIANVCNFWSIGALTNIHMEVMLTFFCFSFVIFSVGIRVVGIGNGSLK